MKCSLYLEGCLVQQFFFSSPDQLVLFVVVVGTYQITKNSWGEEVDDRRVSPFDTDWRLDQCPVAGSRSEIIRYFVNKIGRWCPLFFNLKKPPLFFMIIHALVRDCLSYWIHIVTTPAFSLSLIQLAIKPTENRHRTSFNGWGGRNRVHSHHVAVL